MRRSLARLCTGPFLAVVALSASAQQRSEPGPALAVATTISIDGDRPGPTYDRRIFSQFSEHLGNGIYGGLWVGEASKIPNTRGFRNDVVAALRALNVPVIRWPGGCFADEYHWREGVGPRAQRPVKVNTNWGGVTEPNTVGTHEFMDLTDQIGAQPYVSGNVGDGTPRELAEWVEYMTAPAGTLADERARNGRKAPWAVPYVGIGNELWGCGGNMRPDYAADVTRRYATFIKAPGGVPLTKIASGANSDDYNWTDTMMRVVGDKVDALSLHYYTVPGGWPPRASATDFGEAEWASTLAATWRMDDMIARHSAIMDKYDPQKKVWLAVDEWGTWYAADPGTNGAFLRQQNSLRDAVVAAVNFNIFARHADRVRMTVIAQMVNVLQAMILTDGPQMLRTPTYHVFALYKPFMDATVLPITVDSPTYRNGASTMPMVSAAAVRSRDGVVHVSLVNLDPNRATTVTIGLKGLTARGVSGQIITAPKLNAINTFDARNVVAPAPFAGARIAGGKLVVALPSKAVVMLSLR